ncbi:GGDEF domain-containing protein [Micromonospora echinospora]|uniref:GGDEF domain-containing protein n=1 Tax=Micromonospora echinospora TaxID=1877 RepID=UPI003787F204
MTAPTIDVNALLAELAQVRRENADLRVERDQWRKQAIHDPLTGLLNRDGLAEVWQVDVDHRHSLGLVDLDRFKQINDRYGHGAGDGVLRHVADALDGRFQFVARLGGDELVIVDRTHRLGDLVHDPLLWRVPVAGRTLTVTGTVGLTQAVSSQAVTLGRADLAMYRAKASRRGLATWWSGAIDGQAELGVRPAVRLRDTRVVAR